MYIFCNYYWANIVWRRSILPKCQAKSWMSYSDYYTTYAQAQPWFGNGMRVMIMSLFMILWMMINLSWFFPLSSDNHDGDGDGEHVRLKMLASVACTHLCYKAVGRDGKEEAIWKQWRSAWLGIKVAVGNKSLAKLTCSGIPGSITVHMLRGQIIENWKTVPTSRSQQSSSFQEIGGGQMIFEK